MLFNALLSGMIALSSAATSTTAPAPAPARVAVHTATADYVRSVDAQGNMRLVGQYQPFGETFNFQVSSDGRVRGWVGNKPVAFRLADIEQRSE